MSTPAIHSNVLSPCKQLPKTSPAFAVYFAQSANLNLSGEFCAFLSTAMFMANTEFRIPWLFQHGKHGENVPKNAKMCQKNTGKHRLTITSAAT